MKKFLLYLLGLPTRLRNYFHMKRKHVSYGKNLKLNGRVHFHGSGKFVIGNQVTIQSDPNVNPCAGGLAAHFTCDKNAVLKIGNHVGISHCAITAANSVIIEDDVLLGSNCMIADTDFHSIDFEKRNSGNDDTVKVAPVLIRKGAFIGARSIILKGVTVGEYSVVGAGSVVTKSIPDGEIWAGNPAKFIKNNVSRVI